MGDSQVDLGFPRLPLEKVVWFGMVRRRGAAVPAKILELDGLVTLILLRPGKKILQVTSEHPVAVSSLRPLPEGRIIKALSGLGVVT